MTGRHLKRSGANLTAERLLRGEVLVLRPLQLYISSLLLIGVGLFATLSAAVFERNFGTLAAILGSGLGPAVFVVGGVLHGPLVSLSVTADGIRVGNPLRTVDMPWRCIMDARVGMFGLRLRTSDFEISVFAAQSNNWEGFREPVDRSVEKLARRLIEVRDDIVARGGASGQHSGSRASVRRWRTPWPAVIAVTTYTLLVGLYVHLG